MSKIIVVGAGITGVTSAYALLERGHSVTVLDRLRYPAMETSYANGGQLSASNGEVWNSWSTILKGLKWTFRPDAPLLMNLTPSWRKLSWLAEFCSHIGDHRANTIETVRLAIAARAHLFRMAETEKIEFDLRHDGLLHVYYDQASFDKAARGNALLQEAGLKRHAVTRAEIAAIEPPLTGDFRGGFFTPSDASGDIHKFTRGLAAACERRGAVFHQEVEATGIDTTEAGVLVRFRTDAGREETLEADAVLVCAGVASTQIAAALGDRINIYPVKGYSITLGLPDAQSQAAAPKVALLDEDAKIVTSRLGADRLRVAGTAEFNGYNKDIRADRIAPLVRWTERLFPGVPTEDIIPWAGLRPMTPTMLPRVGPGRRPRVFYNTGHGHLGWTLSAATAQIVADQIDAASRGRW